MPSLFRPAASLLALALLLAACSGAPSGTAGSDATDAPTTSSSVGDLPTSEPPLDAPASPGTTLTACEIVTPADIEAATGASSVDPGELESTPTSLSPGRTECTYQGDWGRLIVELTPEDGVNLYDAARSSYDDASDITGVGDGAFHSAANKRAFVVSGPVAVMFTLFVNGSEPYEVAEALAASVVAKL